MYFVQFFQESVWGPNKGSPIEATGDRSVVVLDGRESLGAQMTFSRAECAKRGYIGFQLFKGDSFSRSTSYTRYESVPRQADVHQMEEGDELQDYVSCERPAY
jgi:hypothetical protein